MNRIKKLTGTGFVAALVLGGLPFVVHSSVNAADFAKVPLSDDHKCKLVRTLVDSFNDSEDGRVYSITIGTRWYKGSTKEISTLDHLEKFLTEIDVDVFHEGRFLELDLRPDRVALSFPNDRRVTTSCG
ncbi:MAG: hypothetical protein ACRBM6_35675 [Geminicoccales bacterium]